MEFTGNCFFNKRFMGIGVDIDTYLPIALRTPSLAIRITLLYFRIWVEFYKN